MEGSSLQSSKIWRRLARKRLTLHCRFWSPSAIFAWLAGTSVGLPLCYINTHMTFNDKHYVKRYWSRVAAFVCCDSVPGQPSVARSESVCSSKLVA